MIESPQLKGAPMSLEKYSNSHDSGVINGLNGNYLHWTKIQLKELHKHLHSLKEDDLTLKESGLILQQNDRQKTKDTRTEILDILHNIIGLGGSFGYYMITDIADSLNKYIRSIEEFPNVDPKIIAAHLNAMDYIIACNIGGYGGERGKNIMAHLQRKLPKEACRLATANA